MDNFRSGRERSPRKDRARSPPAGNWYPNNGRDRSPRHRSRTPLRRLRTPPKDNWRVRSPRRRSPPRRFSPRREDNRRPRSPFRRDERRKSRSPFERERIPQRIRSPIRRASPPAGPRGFRPRSRSPDRREIPKGPSANRRHRSHTPPARRTDRSTLNSRNNSRRSSPPNYPDRMHLPQPQIRQRSPPRTSPGPSHRDRDSARPVIRERSRPRSTAPKSPPRGPAGLRAPTGPGRHRNSTGPVLSSSNNSGVHLASRQKPEGPGPVAPPSGPRGYIPRGGSSIRGGRSSFGTERVSKSEGSSWGAAPPNRVTQTPEFSRSTAESHPRSSTSASQQTTLSSVPSTPFLASTLNGASGAIPTGPRAGVSSRPSPKLQHSSSSYNRSAQSAPTSNGPRPHPALANTPAIITGGRIDPTASGIAPEVSMRLKRKEEEEEILRVELQAKEEKLRHSLKHWDKLSRESSAMGLRSDLSEKHVRTLAGEGGGGAF